MLNNCSVSIIDGTDYQFTSEQLTITPGTTGDPPCILILILNDLVVEDTKIFSVNLTTTDSDVLLHPSSAVITIEDDDSEFDIVDMHDQQVFVSPTLISILLSLCSGNY